MPVHKQVAPLQQNGRILVLVAVGALGVSCVMTQLALMRELLAAFSGNEMVFGIVLGLWLLLMGIGTWLGRVSERIWMPEFAAALRRKSANSSKSAGLPSFQTR